MVGHHRLPSTNTATPASVSAATVKQDQETSSRLRSRKPVTCHRFCLIVISTLCLFLMVTCAALSVLYSNESDNKPEWKSLFDYQNLSNSYWHLTSEKNDLKKHNEILREQVSWIQEQNKLLNKTLGKLRSMNLALTLKSSEFTDQIVNLTSSNTQLVHEHQQLVRYVTEQQETRLNTSQTIKQLSSSRNLLQEEKRRLTQINGLLTEELQQEKENNQELVDINNKFQREIQNLSERIEASKHDHKTLQQEVTQLQEQKLNLSLMLVMKKQEAAEQERNQTVEMEQMAVAYNTLDMYCPVVDQKTKERSCKRCDSSWKLFESKCYYFSSRSLTWSSSRTWCRTQGGDLLVINSQREQEFVFESSQTLDPSTRLWIGLTDAEDEGDWFWVDGRRVTSDVQFWLNRSGTGTEPDDWKVDDPQGEDCGHIDTSETALSSWLDGSCQILYRWICEKNI